jgi:hypothetical protein
MPRRDDVVVQLKDAAPAAAAATGAVATPAPVTGCTCDEFRRNQVCDHVLMAAAVRMVHRMIDLQKDEDQKPH